MTRETQPPETAALAAAIAAAEPSAARPLSELVQRLAAAGLLTGSGGESLADASTTRVTGVRYDSRRVRRGDLFVAIPGLHSDGHDFLAAAAAAGCTAALVERPVLDDQPGDRSAYARLAPAVPAPDLPAPDLPVPDLPVPDLPAPGPRVPQIVVLSSRAALAQAAAWWYGDPSLELGVVGVTGTDGKTTTSYLAVAALEAAGISTGLVGTAETRIGAIRAANPEHVTTPEAPELQAALRAMVASGNRVAVVETTSHGLALERVAAVAYDIAVFTNLSHEHLELHGTFEAYRAAKLRLFRGLAGPSRKPWPRAGIVNLDDRSAGPFIEATHAAGARLLTYGVHPDATVRAGHVADEPDRLRVGVEAPGWSGEIALRLAGRFNAQNALAVVALGIALDLDPEAVRAGLEGVEGVPGRMERIDAGQPFAVIVDYAHSPAALAKVLDELAATAQARGGSCIVVFGSAGERDLAKRPAMGRIAAERCRVVVVTDEDPRGEDREAILDEIAAGAVDGGRNRGADLLVIPDRAEAIAAALGAARPGDVVLLAGKGHEQTILYADHALAWDERAEALRALAAMGYDKGGTRT